VVISVAAAYPQLNCCGGQMTDNELAVLKSLVLRPSQPASSMMKAILILLHEQGYVAPGQAGWSATAKGCLAVEQVRRSPAAVEIWNTRA
jgi:hypothetical protein